VGTSAELGPHHRVTSLRLAAITICLAALLGGGLRAVRAHAYLPWTHHYDEMSNIPVAEDMVRSRSTLPDWHPYPTFMYAAEAAVLVPAELVGAYEPGDPADTVLEVETLGNGRTDHPRLLAALRWSTSVLPGMVMVAATGATAWILTRRWWAAGFAALVAALSAVDVAFGTFVTPDALAGSATAIALLTAVVLARRPTWPHYLFAGAAVGLATSCKYNAAVVAVAVVAAHWVAHGRLQAAPGKLLGAASVALGVFSLLNHVLIVDPAALWRDVKAVNEIYRSGIPGHEGSALVFNAQTLFWSFGASLLLPVAAFLPGRDRNFSRGAWIIGSFVVAYYVVFSSYVVRVERNLLSMTSAVAVLAAMGLVVLVDRLRAAAPRWRGAAVVTAVVVLALALPLWSTGGVLQDMRQDPWSDAQNWLAMNAPAGSTIAVEPRGPYVDRDRYIVLAADGDQTQSLWSDADYYVANRFDFEPNPAGCKLFEIDAPWEGEAKRIVIVKPC
jgi:Dolichyl-phosphate-mannose-protein mannosyltransferase